MYHKETWKSRMKQTGILRKILLFFFIGFFFGGLFYYIFQHSFSSLVDSLEGNVAGWSGERQDSALNLIRVIWNHGKYFALLWLLSVSRIHHGYQIGFTLYTGIRNGFLLLFFLYARGVRGILLYLFSLLPHGLVFAPLYLFCFMWIDESRPIRHKVPVTAAVIFSFFLACFMESRWNLPLMRWGLSY